jgi:crotonobetainyl-CoA:carnitine CoA-transferase CaiB-like acyl-CoA transferase
MQDHLKGIRVLEVAQWWFVPAAGAVLADWGADVIKIEHPVSGDGQRGLVASGLIPGDNSGVSFMMEQSNRGKRSVGLDLATERGRKILYRLAESSDVFLTNFLTPARRKLAIDLADIRAVNPDIIYVRGSGQGVRGPDAEKAGYDGTAFWSRGGVGQAITRDWMEYPVMPRAALGDSIGAMTIAGGIAAALLKRERSGEPSVVDVSLMGTAMWALGADLVAADLTGSAMPSFDHGSSPNPVVGTYRTKDGRWIMFNYLQADRWWPDLCRRMDREDLITDERFKDAASRYHNAEACVTELDAIFASRTLDQWREALADAEGAWAPYQTTPEVLADPQTEANGYLPEIEVNGRKVRLVANPVQFDETPPTLTRAPEHGEHTEQVLLELGMDWNEIAEGKKDGSVL